MDHFFPQIRRRFQHHDNQLGLVRSQVIMSSNHYCLCLFLQIPFGASTLWFLAITKQKGPTAIIIGIVMIITTTLKVKNHEKGQQQFQNRQQDLEVNVT